MFAWLAEFLKSEDAAVIGTGAASILGGFVIAWRAIKRGQGSQSPAIVEGANARDDVLEAVKGVRSRMDVIEQDGQERDERLEERQIEIAKSVAETLKLVIRLDERTQNRRG